MVINFNENWNIKMVDSASRLQKLALTEKGKLFAPPHYRFFFLNRLTVRCLLSQISGLPAELLLRLGNCQASSDIRDDARILTRGS